MTGASGQLWSPQLFLQESEFVDEFFILYDKKVEFILLLIVLPGVLIIFTLIANILFGKFRKKENSYIDFHQKFISKNIVLPQLILSRGNSFCLHCTKLEDMVM